MMGNLIEMYKIIRGIDRVNAVFCPGESRTRGHRFMVMEKDLMEARGTTGFFTQREVGI